MKKSKLGKVSARANADKTELLDYLNGILETNSKCVAVSHARRFGKSHAAGMIDAYYSRGCDSTDLFKDTKISSKKDFQERSSVLAAECASALLTSSSAHSCNPPEAFISAPGLYPPLRLICFYSPLIEVGVFPTEIKIMIWILRAQKPGAMVI